MPGNYDIYEVLSECYSQSKFDFNGKFVSFNFSAIEFFCKVKMIELTPYDMDKIIAVKNSYFMNEEGETKEKGDG